MDERTSGQRLFTDPDDNVQLARPSHAARLVGVHVRTIYHWIKAGKVRVRYAAGGVVLVEVASLFTRQRPQYARVGRRVGDGGDVQPAA